MKRLIVVLASAMMLMPGLSAPVSAVTANSQQCAGWSKTHTPPPYIRVYFPLGKHVVKVPFKEYIGAVMAAGASPVAKYRPLQAHAVMAFAIMGYAWWEANHPSNYKRSPSGKCYDIRNGGWDHAQYVRPNSGWKHPSKIQRDAIDLVWGWRARAHSGRWIRPGWTAGYQTACRKHDNGWHLPEDETTDCARRGMDWKKIVRIYLGCCTLVNVTPYPNRQREQA